MNHPVTKEILEKSMEHNPNKLDLIEGEWYMCTVKTLNGTKDRPMQYTADREEAYYVPEKFSDTCPIIIQNYMEIIPND